MTQEKFLERLATLARFCGVAVREEELEFYDRAFAVIGYGAGVAAVEEEIVTRRTRDPFPSVADLARRAVKAPSDEDQAVEVSGRILEAVTKIGFYRRADALEFIGEVGAYVVERSGGWETLCRTIAPAQLTTWRAQFRDLALSAIRRHKMGLLNAAPTFSQTALPSGVKALVDSTMKKLTGGTPDGKASGSGEAAIRDRAGSGQRIGENGPPRIDKGDRLR